MTLQYDEMHDHIVCQLDELYRDFKGSDTYKFPRNQRNLKCVDSFIKRITNTKYSSTIISKNYITRVLKFCFGHYVNKTVNFHGNKVIFVSHVLSKKVFEYYQRLNPRHIHVTQVNRSKRIKKSRRKPTYKPATEQQQDRYKLITETQRHEEYEKARFHNKTKGYFWCLTMTTMFNHKSQKCSECKFAKICKKRLQENQPTIYSIRGYEQKTQGKNI